ncbi:HAD-IIA family hydrolase [Oceanicella actignis]|uniref:HAD-IIA family hydrolase n=1 Tax=Oceanicella actignis TaxID=1189325 RepID=UPI0011E7D2B1|nr:HAD-IIA family hydrolase [Oceanicella actignis]TYO90603.1 HAD superfamily hydrolase (TIGR01450 family) [Oceanicella actignis]
MTLQEREASGPEAIFALYLRAAPRLPRAPRRGAARPAPDLGALAGSFDLFVLDAFGVLNIGERAVPGAAERIARLRAMGKKVMVATNAAGYPKSRLLARYAALGFDFAPDEVVSSRETLLAALQDQPPRRWGVMADPAWGEEELEGLDARFLLDDPADYARAEGFLLLGSGAWTPARQAMLAETLARDPRPVLVGNPDLAAPRDRGHSQEPGRFAHMLAEIPGVTPQFYGKPFGAIFERVLARAGTAPERAVMVGDTLHTDVLGGLAAGMSAALVTDAGSIHQGRAGRDMARADLWPDYVLPRI